MAAIIDGARLERIPAKLLLGEGSLWAPRLQKWLLVNIHGKTAHTLDTAVPSSPQLRTYLLPEQVGTIVLRAPSAARGGSEQALVALKSGLAFLDLDSGAVTVLPGAPLEPPKNRWNDGKCSPEGRFWGGTMEDATFAAGVGTLYVVDPAAAGAAAPPPPRKALGGITISNGLAWSPDGRTMFYIDTPRNDVQAFDYDPATGALSNGRVAFKTAYANPDGCAMDAAGRLWVAHWGASRVACYETAQGSAGAVVTEVHVPKATRVSSCAFGGPGLRDLLITTAFEGLSPEISEAERAALGEDNAGDVFLVRDVGVAGLPPCDYLG